MFSSDLTSRLNPSKLDNGAVTNLVDVNSFMQNRAFVLKALEVRRRLTISDTSVIF